MSWCKSTTISTYTDKVSHLFADNHNIRMEPSARWFVDKTAVTAVATSTTASDALITCGSFWIGRRLVDDCISLAPEVDDGKGKGSAGGGTRAAAPTRWLPPPAAVVLLEMLEWESQAKWWTPCCLRRIDVPALALPAFRTQPFQVNESAGRVTIWASQFRTENDAGATVSVRCNCCSKNN